MKAGLPPIPERSLGILLKGNISDRSKSSHQECMQNDHLMENSLLSTINKPLFYNNQQIYKKIIDWFEVWRPWQKQILLSELTNR